MVECDRRLFRYKFYVFGGTTGVCEEVVVEAENRTEATSEAWAAFHELCDDYREDEDYFLDLRYTDAPVW